MMRVCEDHPLIGTEYHGSVVQKVKEERELRPDGIIKESIQIYVESGMCYSERRWLQNQSEPSEKTAAATEPKPKSEREREREREPGRAGRRSISKTASPTKQPMDPVPSKLGLSLPLPLPLWWQSVPEPSELEKVRTKSIEKVSRKSLLNKPNNGTEQEDVTTPTSETESSSSNPNPNPPQMMPVERLASTSTARARARARVRARAVTVPRQASDRALERTTQLGSKHNKHKDRAHKKTYPYPTTGAVTSTDPVQTRTVPLVSDRLETEPGYNSCNGNRDSTSSGSVHELLKKRTNSGSETQHNHNHIDPPDTNNDMEVENENSTCREQLRVTPTEQTKNFADRSNEEDKPNNNSNTDSNTSFSDGLIETQEDCIPNTNTTSTSTTNTTHAIGDENKACHKRTALIEESKQKIALSHSTVPLPSALCRTTSLLKPVRGITPKPDCPPPSLCHPKAFDPWLYQKHPPPFQMKLVQRIPPTNPDPPPSLCRLEAFDPWLRQKHPPPSQMKLVRRITPKPDPPPSLCHPEAFDPWAH
eukprot:jgi/Psemu1/287072/fgenesh1_pg.173_\